MRKIKLYIAVSLDGYIATPDGGVEWLNQFQITGNEDYGYKELYLSIDTVLMGGRTYRDIIGFGCEWPYKDKVSYIISRYLPIVLGQGFALFPNKPKETVWKLIGSKSFDSGAMLISYSK